jgi:molecular chaperone GrpE
MARQYEEMMRFANDRILLELLEVVDNFERALHHENDNTDFETFRKGTELIFSQIDALLGKYDIMPIEALGEPFDPNLHEAVMPIESEDYPEGVVAIEMSKGYMQGDRVLRHSKVGVSRGKPKDKEEGRK